MPCSTSSHQIASAIRVDFGSEKTREFYGSIRTGEDVITAVTIYDDTHFVVDDKDRILFVVVIGMFAYLDTKFDKIDTRINVMRAESASDVGRPEERLDKLAMVRVQLSQ